MYNRYIPRDAAYVPAGQEAPQRREDGKRNGPAGAGERARKGPGSAGPGPAAGSFSSLFPGREKLNALLSPGRGEGGLSALLKGLKLGDWDSGDLLLLLIVLLLLSEGDDLELVIALGLALMMGLGEGKQGEAEERSRQ